MSRREKKSPAQNAVPDSASAVVPVPHKIEHPAPDQTAPHGTLTVAAPDELPPVLDESAAADAASGRSHRFTRWLRSPAISRRQWMRGALSLGGAGLLGGIVYQVWNRLPSGVVRRLTAADAGNVTRVLFSVNGRYLAAASSTGLVSLWRTGSFEPVELAAQSQQPLTGLAATEDGFLVTSTLGERLIVWELKTQQPRILPSLPATPTALAVRAGHPQLLIGLVDGQLFVLDTLRGTSQLRKTAHRGAIQAVVSSPDGDWYATSGADGKVLVVSAETGEERAQLPGHQRDVVALTVSKDGRTLVSGDWDGLIKIWRLPDLKEAKSLRIDAPVSSLILAGNQLFAADWTGKIRFGRWRNEWPDETWSQPQAVLSLAVSPDGRWLASAGPGNQIDLRDVQIQTRVD